MDMLNDHEIRITQVERSISDLGNKVDTVQKDVTSMQASQNRMETAVLEQGRQTRETLERTIDRLFERDNHIREKSTDVRLKWLGILGSVFGSGGIIMAIISLFM